MTVSVVTVQGKLWHQESYQKMDLFPSFLQMPAGSKLSDNLGKIKQHLIFDLLSSET